MPRVPAAKARLAEVAELAGVSAATVSRVINSPEKVSDELRRRVAAALRELDYVPHGAARALASRRSRTVGAIVPTLDIAVFAAGVVALQNRLENAGYTLFVANAEYDPAKEAKEARALIERGVDGLVLVGAQHRPEVYRWLAKHRIPYVNTYTLGPEHEHPCIGIDHRRPARQMIDHLFDLGHREFGIITGPVRNNDRNRTRRDGLLQALGEHGIALSAGRAVEVPYSIAGGRRGLRALLGSGGGLSAVACTADIMAIGAMAECRELGIRVPDQISIAGFDDLDLAAHLDPPLTTVRIPAGEVGRRAGEYLLARIEGLAVPDRVELSAHLILRGSTGRPPG